MTAHCVVVKCNDRLILSFGKFIRQEGSVALLLRTADGLFDDCQGTAVSSPGACGTWLVPPCRLRSSREVGHLPPFLMRSVASGGLSSGVPPFFQLVSLVFGPPVGGASAASPARPSGRRAAARTAWTVPIQPFRQRYDFTWCSRGSVSPAKHCRIPVGSAVGPLHSEEGPS